MLCRMVANNFFSSKNSFLKLIIFWGITMKLFPWWAFSVVTYFEIIISPKFSKTKTFKTKAERTEISFWVALREKRGSFFFFY